MTLVKLSLNKRGKVIAHYWSINRRWLPMSAEEAKYLIATGAAQAVDHGEALFAHKKD